MNCSSRRTNLLDRDHAIGPSCEFAFSRAANGILVKCRVSDAEQGPAGSRLRRFVDDTYATDGTE